MSVPTNPDDMYTFMQHIDQFPNELEKVDGVKGIAESLGSDIQNGLSMKDDFSSRKDK